MKSISTRATQKYRALREGAPTDDKPIDYVAIFDNYDGFCGVCDRPVSFEAAVWDHIVPIDKGGSHVASNLQPTHNRCNCIKGNRTLAWARQRVKEIDYGGILALDLQ